MTHPWEYEALFNKAKLFLNHAMDPEENRDFNERALWATLALELLAKSALSKYSPVLIAHPDADGDHLLAVCGFGEINTEFKSIPAKALFSRCAKAFRPFSERKAIRFVYDRNAYIHGATSIFSNVPEKHWWPGFWKQVQILVLACDSELEDLVGTTRVQVVEELLEQNEEHQKDLFEAIKERHRTASGRYSKRLMSADEEKRWNQKKTGRFSSYSDQANCPFCNEQGELCGDTIVNTHRRTYQWSDGRFESLIESTVLADYFICTNCDFILDSYELLEVAGLPTDFEVIRDIEDFEEEDYGND